MLPLHAGGDLDPRHAPAVDRHLSGCLPCFREFGELSAMRARLAVLAAQPLPAGILDGFADEVMARVAVGEPGPVAQAPRPGPRPVFLPRLAAAAALLLVTLAGWRLFDDGGMLPGRELGLQAASSPVADGQPAVRVDVPVGVVTSPPRRRFGGTPAAGATLDPVSTMPNLLMGNDTLPDAMSFQIRLRGGVPGSAVIMRSGPGGGLQLDGDRQPRARRP